MSQTVTTIDGVVQTVSNVLTSVGPLIAAAFPGVTGGLAIAAAIVQGVIAAEPAAVALYQQITGGTQPTAAQLAQYIANNDALNAQMDADVTAALQAAQPAAS